MAGSDAGRLWRHPQLEALYDHVLRSADVVVAVGPVAERADRSTASTANRIAPGAGYALPEDCLRRKGRRSISTRCAANARHDPNCRRPAMGLASQPSRPHFGIYGKLGDNKGSFALLAAMHELKLAGLDVGLVALAHGRPEIQASDFASAPKSSVLRTAFCKFHSCRIGGCRNSCAAVWPCAVSSRIFRSAFTARSFLSKCCFAARVSSLRPKSSASFRIMAGCRTAMAASRSDVNDVGALADALASIVREPELVTTVGARGRAFAQEMQRDIEFPADD